MNGVLEDTYCELWIQYGLPAVILGRPPGAAFRLHVVFLFFLFPVVWSWMFRRKAVDDSLEFRPGGPIGCP